MRFQTVALILTLCAAAGGCDSGHSLMRKNAPPATPSRVGPDGAPSYVGRWAASTAACGHAAWTLNSGNFESAGGLRCSVSQVTPTSAGFTVNTSCSSGGAPTPGRIVMTMVGAQPVHSITMSGGPFAEPVSLVRCPAQITVAPPVATSSDSGSSQP